MGLCNLVVGVREGSLEQVHFGEQFVVGLENGVQGERLLFDWLLQLLEVGVVAVEQMIVGVERLGYFGGSVDMRIGLIYLTLHQPALLHVIAVIIGSATIVSAASVVLLYLPLQVGYGEL